MNLYDKKQAWILGGFEFLRVDNVEADAGAGGATFATDDIGGVHYPRSKIAWGVDGAAVDASASNPLPVVQTGTPALPTGAATSAKQDTEIASLATIAGAVAGTEMQVDIVSAPTISVNDAGGALTVDDGGSSITVDYATTGSGTATGALRVELPTNGTGVIATVGAVTAITNALPAGTNAIGKLAANSGVDIGDVDVTSVVPGTGATNLGKAEDAAHSSGDVGIMALAVQQTADAALAGTTGDYAPLQVDENGFLKVNIKAGAGSGGTAMTDDAAFTPGSTSVTPIAGTYRSVRDSVDDNDAGALAMTAKRGLYTVIETPTGDSAMDDTNDAVRVNVVAGGGSGGTSATDDSAFTVASGSGTPIMGLADETGPDSVDEGDVGVVRMTLARALHVNLRDSSGNELAAGYQYAEDAVHASGDYVTMAGVVRKDAATQLAGTDGDNSVLVNDASGRLHVNVGALPSGTVAGSSSLPAGTNNIGDVDVLSVPSDPFGANADAASATGSISAKLRFIASTGIPITGTVTVGSHAVTNAGTFAVQAAQSGTWTVQPGNTANTTPWLTTQTPATSGGYSISRTLSAASNNATSVKGSAGQVFGWYLYNANAAVRYLKLYNKATSPTVGTDTPVLTIPIPPGSAANVEFVGGIAFGTGIGLGIVTGVGDADNTSVAANEIIVNLFYK